MVKGPGFDVNSNISKRDTIYPYRKHNGGGRNKPIFECVSDHAILTLDVAFRKEELKTNVVVVPCIALLSLEAAL